MAQPGQVRWRVFQGIEALFPGYLALPATSCIALAAWLSTFTGVGSPRLKRVDETQSNSLREFQCPSPQPGPLTTYKTLPVQVSRHWDEPLLEPTVRASIRLRPFWLFPYGSLPEASHSRTVRLLKQRFTRGIYLCGSRSRDDPNQNPKGLSDLINRRRPPPRSHGRPPRVQNVVDEPTTTIRRDEEQLRRNVTQITHPY